MGTDKILVHNNCDFDELMKRMGNSVDNFSGTVNTQAQKWGDFHVSIHGINKHRDYTGPF